MHHAMNINHEWNRLKLELDNNTYVVALLYINPISTKRCYFFGEDIKVWNNSIGKNCLHNHGSKIDYIITIHYML